MNAFDIMAEAKMRQWEKSKKEGKAKQSTGKQLVSVSSGDSLEKQLFADIKRLIKRSHQEEHCLREATLLEAEKLQVQLSTRLESSGCYYLAKYLFDEINKLRVNEGA
jgi:hypothetical protein